MKRRIQKWDIKSLSMAGRITIIRSIISALPIYSLSFQPLPKQTLKLITRYQRDFLWGSDSLARKIPWIKWEDLCRPKTLGGLGFLNLLSFNSALLCKWIWRFVSPDTNLWKKLIISRHGMPLWAKLGGAYDGTRSKSTGWWQIISNLATGEDGKLFWNLLERKLGNGSDTLFWEGSWTGSSPLKTRFPRLFNLCSKKDAKVSDMGRWEQGKWIWDLPWRRELQSSEKAMSDDLLASLVTCPQSASSADHWAWKGSFNSGTLVKRLYLDIQKRNGRPLCPENRQQLFKLIWNSTAPFKAQVLGWRIIWNRLPTFDNLNKRINTSGMDSRCSFCKIMDDTCRHLFVECPKVRIIWDDIVTWIGVTWAVPNCTHEHLRCFSYLLGARGIKNLSGLWTCVVWVWWKWRNEILFGRKEWDLRKIIDEIKCRFWNWCVARGEAEANLSFNYWCSIHLSQLWPPL